MSNWHETQEIEPEQTDPTLQFSIVQALRIKICGITKPEQGRAIAELGATALGFICAPQSTRFVAPEQIATIVAELPQRQGKRCDRIGVFVNASQETIIQTVEIGNLSGIQLHGDESPEFCAQLQRSLPHIEIIKAFRVKSIEVLQQANLYQTCVNSLLLDAYHPTLAGGTGTTLDWQMLHDFHSPLPWFLAGGLTPNNVVNALNLKPHGIDLSSGVERSPGDKDLDLVKQLFAQLSQFQDCS